MNNTALKHDVRETRYEIIFHGTCGRERKVRCHRLPLSGAAEEAVAEGREVEFYVKDTLRHYVARKGKWSLTSYVAFVSEYVIDGVIQTIAMRPLFDTSTKTLLSGELLK